MTGAKGKSGRKKLPGKVLQDRLEQLDGDIPSIIDVLLDEALGKPIICQFCGEETGKKQIDREAGKKLIEMRLGKDRQVTEIDLLARTELTSGQAIKLYRQIQGYADQYALEQPGPLLDQVKLLTVASDKDKAEANASDNGHSANQQIEVEATSDSMEVE